MLSPERVDNRWRRYGWNLAERKRKTFFFSSSSCAFDDRLKMVEEALRIWLEVDLVSLCRLFVTSQSLFWQMSAVKYTRPICFVCFFGGGFPPPNLLLSVESIRTEHIHKVGAGQMISRVVKLTWFYIYNDHIFRLTSGERLCLIPCTCFSKTQATSQLVKRFLLNCETVWVILLWHA